MKNIQTTKSSNKQLKLFGLLTFFILFGFSSVVKIYALPPTLGNYPNTSVVSGGNTTIIPDTVPTDVLNAVAFTNTNFRGTLVVNPITGVLTVTNARQSGIYTITIKAFGAGGVFVTTSFILTVFNPICSHPELASTIDTLSGPVAIGDFNGDGFQDLAIANSPSASSNIVSIMTGDGMGGFTGTNNVVVGSNPASVAVGDFNGDGSLDIITCGGFSASVRLGNGSGGFSGTTDIPVGANPIQVGLGDFNNDGLTDFATVNNSGDDVSIRLGDGTGNFTGNGEFAVGLWPFSIAVGDFNNDGNQDLATADFLSTAVSVLLGDGTGMFTLFQSVSVGMDPGFVALGDFNGDGNQDLGTTNDYSNTVSIRMGNGTGSFGGSTEVAVGCGPISFAVVDFNGDGFQDLVTTNKFCNYFYTNTLSIRYGDGNGNFSGFEEINAGGVGPNSITVGDFNGDGKQDLVVTNTSNVSIFLGGGPDINVKGNNVSIADGDITPDVSDYTDFGSGPFSRTFTIENTGGSILTLGPNPITITGPNASDFSLMLQPATTVPPNGTVIFTIMFFAGGTGVRNATINIANDGCDESPFDFAISGTGGLSPTLGTYPNTTLISGTNTTVIPGASPTNTLSARAYTTADFTGGLVVDHVTGILSITNAMQAGVYTIVVQAFGGGGIFDTTSFTLTVTNPTCSQARFATASAASVGNGPVSVSIGDFNGDGNQDIVSGSQYYTSGLSIRLGDGAGGFSGTTNFNLGWVVATAVGDLNGDGNQDVVAAINSMWPGYVVIKLGDGSGGFISAPNVNVGDIPTSVALGDFNNDHIQDLVVTNEYSNSVSIRLGTGTGEFIGNTEFPCGFPQWVTVGEFNGDSNQDLAIVAGGGGSLFIHLGDGYGGFSGATSIAIGSYPRCVSTGDFNSDGKTDLATANFSSGTVSIRLGDGNGGFYGTTDLQVGNPQNVAVGDFNGDGFQDVIVANGVAGMGDGLGGFSLTTFYNGGASEAVAVGDFNNDGKQDITYSNSGFGSTTLSVLLGGEAEINILGNGVSIADGDIAPNITDNTEFLSGSYTHVFTLENTGTTPLTLGSNALTVTGANASDFIVTDQPDSIVPAGGNTEFTILFAPGSSGWRSATINIANDDCNESNYDFAVQGYVLPTPPAGSCTLTSIPLTGCVGNVVTISTNIVPGATEYNWSVSSGSLINGLPSPQTTTSNSVNVTLGVPQASSSGWEVCVFASNISGQTNTNCKYIRGKLSMPSSIVGSKVACANTTGNYSTNAVNGSQGYQWTGTNGITFSGSGLSVTANFPAGFTTGTICVSATLSCGYTGPSRCLTVNNTVLSVGAISGTFKVCPGSTGIAFSVPAVNGIQSYNWTVPTGITIAGGVGTNAITVDIDSTYNTGNICLVGTSACGVNSALRCKTISSSKPGKPGNFTTGDLYGVCGQTITYTIAAVTGATSYTWTAPSGASLASSNGTNFIDVTFTSGYTIGNLCVVANNSCGSGSPRCVSIKGALSIPGIISGPNVVCANQSGDIYSIAPVPFATGYNWTVPQGAAITNGLGTASIILDWGNNGGVIGVTASGPCSNSGTRTLTVAMNCKVSNNQMPGTEINAYPNPVSGILNIDVYSEKSGTYTMDLKDLSGRIVYTTILRTTEGINNNQLDVSNYAKSIYILSVRNSAGFAKQIRVAVE